MTQVQEAYNTQVYKLAMGQMQVEGGNPQKNLEKATTMIRQAAAEGCAIIVLPECLNLGWTHPSARKLAEPIPGSHSAVLCQAASEAQIYVVAGLVERGGESIYNAAILIAPDGTIMLKHHKINELEMARDLYSVGETLSVIQTPLGIIGLTICADNLPDSLEIAGTLAGMGAEIILSPSSWAVEANHDNNLTSYGGLWLDAYTTLAQRYQLTVVGVSNVGWITGGPWQGRKCIGCSLVVGSDSKIILQGPYGANAESLLVISIEVNPAALPAGLGQAKSVNFHMNMNKR